MHLCHFPASHVVSLEGILPGVRELDGIGILYSLFPKVVDTLANVYGQWSMGGGAKQEQHSVSS